MGARFNRLPTAVGRRIMRRQRPNLESQAMKGPLEYQTRAMQERIVSAGCRDDVINWLCWNDPNGVYADRDSEAEGYPPLTLHGAREIMARQMA
jgi:hypothetical protein